MQLQHGPQGLYVFVRNDYNAELAGATGFNDAGREGLASGERVSGILIEEGSVIDMNELMVEAPCEIFLSARMTEEQRRDWGCSHYKYSVMSCC